MTLRTRPVTKPVEFLHDGELLPADAGEPLAFGLIAAERLLLARSPKLHRPRGPYCLRAACDGCLVRVDGVPNVMACRHPLRGGETVETQNVVGSRELDLLAATDFMFPHGIDHHRLFAGVRGVSTVLQRAARRIAGLGRLPDQAADVEAARERAVDVLIVGGGATGLALATALGRRATLVEEANLGGAQALLDPQAAAKAVARARASGAELLADSCAVGVFSVNPFGVLVLRRPSVTWMRARWLVLANGGHDAVPDFANNDLPGLFSARAGLALLRGGIAPGERVGVVGSGDFAERAVSELSTRVAFRRARAEEIEAATGTQRVSGLRLHGEKSVSRLDALLFDAPEAPAVELAVQAGAQVRFEPTRGYVLMRDEFGQVAEKVFAAGRLATNGSAARPNIAALVARLD